MAEFTGNIARKVGFGLSVFVAVGTAACQSDRLSPKPSSCPPLAEQATPSSPRTIPPGMFELVVKGNSLDKSCRNLGAVLFKTPTSFNKEDRKGWLRDGARPLTDCKAAGEQYMDTYGPATVISSQWYRIVADSNNQPYNPPLYIGEGYVAIPPAEVPACTPEQIAGK